MTDDYLDLLEKLSTMRKLRIKIMNEINSSLDGLDTKDFLVFNRICRAPQDPTMSYLSDSTGFSNATITLAVDNLEGRGLVTRARGEDRRSYIVQVTDQGRAKYREMEGLKKQRLEAFFENMSKEDLSELQKVLIKLSDLIEKYT